MEDEEWQCILGNLQRCREEREKILREEALAHSSSTRIVDPRKHYFTFTEKKIYDFF